MGLADIILGKDNGFAQWADQNQGLTGALGAGLASRGNFADKLAAAAQYLPAGRAADATAQQQLDATNKTKAWLHANGYDKLIPWVDQGQAPQALAYAFKDQMDQRAASADAATRQRNAQYFKNPQVAQAYMSGAIDFNDAAKLDKNPDAAKKMFGTVLPFIGADQQLGYSQLGEDGQPSVVQPPPGAHWASRVQQLDTGTGYQGVTQFGQQTGTTIPIDNAGKAFQSALGQGAGVAVGDMRGKAQDAALSLQNAQQAEKLLDQGVITGFGADFRVGLGKALQLAGYHGADDAIANTEAFAATRAQEVGRLIKLFGAGTGLSDADREYAAAAAAGKISLTEASIRKILQLNRTAAQNVLNSYNLQIQQMQGNGGMPNMAVQDPTAAPTGTPTQDNPLGLVF